MSDEDKGMIVGNMSNLKPGDIIGCKEAPSIGLRDTAFHPDYRLYPLALTWLNQEILRVDRQGCFTVKGQATADPSVIVDAIREWAIEMGKEIGASK